MDGRQAPHVVVIGGGFGGLKAARTLAKYPVRVTLIDRRNHHLFQPLLYQVATAGLSPGEIAAPIRSILHGNRNVHVLLGEVVDIDVTNRMVKLTDAKVSYNYLVIAARATPSYFGHQQLPPPPPPLQT